MDMEKGQEIAPSDVEKGPEQHAIDVGHHVEHADGRGEDGTEQKRVAVAEEVQKKSRRAAALDAFRGLTIVVHAQEFVLFWFFNLKSSIQLSFYEA